MIDFSTEGLYKQLAERPHVVILGAGASVATIPKEDKYGVHSITMANCIDALKLKDLLLAANIKEKSGNLEAIYSELAERKDCELLKMVIEDKITTYFGNLKLPDTPTIYDYLLLSLRKKDYVFTFNWDPMLIQAYQRVSNITDNLPLMVFLHGNIGMAKCDNCGQIQYSFNSECISCGCESLIRSKLLFPVKDKSYTDDEYISNAWRTFLEVIAGCTILTVFGYSAPSSDIKAVKAMQVAFNSNFRKFDKIEIIDIKPENEISENWNPFFESTNSNYDIIPSFWNSILARFPRRTIEGYCQANIKCWWGDSSIKFRPDLNFEELKNLITPLLNKEKQNDYSVI